MTRTLVIGANGQIGRKLVAAMADNGLAVNAMVRNSEHDQRLEKLGVHIVLGDLEQGIPELAFEGVDRVVFTAGSGGHTGPDKTILIDLWGACKVIDLAVRHKVKQFVMVSSRDAGDPDRGGDAIKPYNVCKHFADRALIDSGVPYTILRPGRLTDEAGTRRVTTTRPQDRDAQAIPREDVAACILHCLTHDDTLNRIYELYEGVEPVAQALAG